MGEQGEVLKKLNYLGSTARDKACWPAPLASAPTSLAALSSGPARLRCWLTGIDRPSYAVLRQLLFEQVAGRKAMTIHAISTHQRQHRIGRGRMTGR